jgi:hypothetical protein
LLATKTLFGLFRVVVSMQRSSYRAYNKRKLSEHDCSGLEFDAFVEGCSVF